MENIACLEIISYEELVEVENNLAFNPFDTTGTSYMSDDLEEHILKDYEEAIEYYYSDTDS